MQILLFLVVQDLMYIASKIRVGLSGDLILIKKELNSFCSIKTLPKSIAVILGKYFYNPPHPLFYAVCKRYVLSLFANDFSAFQACPTSLYTLLATVKTCY